RPAVGAVPEPPAAGVPDRPPPSAQRRGGAHRPPRPSRRGRPALTGHRDQENHWVGGPSDSSTENTITTATSVTTPASSGRRRARPTNRSGTVRPTSSRSRHEVPSSPRRSAERSKGTVRYGMIADPRPSSRARRLQR